MAERRDDVDEVSMCSCPGKQNAYTGGWEDPDGSSAAESGGIERR